MKNMVKETLNPINEYEDMGQIDISDVVWKMDKWMPEDDELQDEFYDLIDDESLSNNKKIQELADFFEIHSNDNLYSYLGNRSIREIAQYIIEYESELGAKIHPYRY